MRFYDTDTDSVLASLQSDGAGLTSAEAERRLAEEGKNKLKEPPKVSMIRRFFETLADPMIIMLLVAAAVQAVVTVLESDGTFAFSDFADVLVILIVVILNTVMSLVQESKAEAAMKALSEMTASTSKVMRDGKQTVIHSEDIVRGDVVVLEAGDSVPADCRILEAHTLKAEEAALTGESVPVQKMVDALMCRDGQNVPLGDRKNMLYSGSTVVYGRGRAVVTATGMDTEMGRIAEALSQAEKEETPLQKKMSELSRFLTKLVLIICAVVFAVGVVEALFFSGEPFSWALLGNTALDTFVAAIALAVAAIPEGLPAVVTIVLSIGVTAMSKRQALIRKLTAVETLGCTQIICSDKTGTLTQNRMTVVDAFTVDADLLAEAMALCSDAVVLPGETESTGEPTEAALVNYALSRNLPRYMLTEAKPRIGEAPFDSMRKMMSTVHKTPNGYVQYTKGATDVVLGRCTGYLTKKGVVPMTDALREEVMRANRAFADRALRVLCAAFRRYDAEPASFEADDLEQDMVFIGLTGMIDPCRPEVYSAIKNCRLAGIRPIMITGDHKDTAVAIAKDLGIITDASEATEGASLDAYTDEELVEVVPNFSVYARVQPEHKTRIVHAWQARGMVTAMTGDGVNDAPSIKAADIGIGMGITGTDVTKGVADIVLADDNFATIVNAVEEGRKIYDNVCKVLQFQLSTNMAEVIIMFVASLLNFRILSPVQLLWINMVTDTLPGLALGMEKAEPDVMKRKPRASTDGIFSGGAGVDMVWQGVYLAVIELISYLIGYRMEMGSLSGLFSGEICAAAMTMAFLCVSFAEIICAVCMRSRRASIVSPYMLRNPNKWLAGALVITVLLSLAAVYMPGLRDVFGMGSLALRPAYVLIAGALALSVVPAFELGKLIHRTLRKRTSKAE